MIQWHGIEKRAFKAWFVQVLKDQSKQILMLHCCGLPYRLYSPSLHGLMNQVKSTHHTIDHCNFQRSMLSLQTLWKKMEIANSHVPVAAVSYQKFIFVTMTQLAEVTTVKKSQYDTFVEQIMFVTTKVCCSEGSKSLLMNQDVFTNICTL